MKSNWVKVKWIGSNIKPFILPLLTMLILAAACSLGGAFLALLSKRLIDSAATGQVHKMIQPVLIMCVLILFDIGARAVASVISSRNSVKISNRLQRRLYAGITKSDWLEYSRYHSGDVLTRLTSDVEAVTSLLISVLPSMISLGVMLTSSIVTLLIFEPFLAVISLFIGPVSLIITRFYGRKLKKLHIKIQETESRYRSFLHEVLQNLVVVKAYCFEQISISRIQNLQNTKLDLISRRSKIGVASNSVLILSSWLGYFLVFLWGAFNLSKGISTFGTFTALIQLVGNIQGPFSGLAHIVPQVISSFASAERIMEIEGLRSETSGSELTGINSAGIQFDNVRFSYKKNSPVLRNATASINPGEIIALIGSSGEGKTTLIHILLSLLHQDKGSVYITDGHSKIEACTSSRKLISYVPQGNTLLSGTIADNLRVGNPNATDQELEDALRQACAWEFIRSLPDGLNTSIGERAAGLSEGQAQRLAIARALLRKTPILILDEATSALDMDTEAKVLHSIRNLNPARTCIIITHRLTALRICDRVLKLENGHLTEVCDEITADPVIEAV